MSNKESIRLRQRRLATGNTSLYLDVYRNGVRSYEYLKMYLIPEKTKADKEKNKQTLQLAETIKAKRTVELHNNEYGFTNKRGSARFFDFYETLLYNNADGSKRSNGCASNWVSTLAFMRQYEKRNITFAEVTPTWINGFKNYLDTQAYRMKGAKEQLSQNSKALYLAKLRTGLKIAMQRGLIHEDPFLGVKGFKREEAEREYLTLEEVKVLAQTPCEYDGIRRAFLFSCLTGLRVSDVRRLCWGDVQQQGDFTRIIFRQKKTKGQEYLDVNAQAVTMMGLRRGDDEKVFREFPQNNNIVSDTIKRWVLRAGIRKNITFHCARHTFAVMMLDIGTDIYTVSKLLGHRELATTQIYARVLDKNKQKAVQNIPSIFE